MPRFLKTSSTLWQKFREINPLLDNFMNQLKKHTAASMRAIPAQCGNYLVNFTAIFSQKFRECNFLLKNFTLN